MNRYIYKLFVTGLLTSALAGCSGSAPAPPSQAKATEPDDAQPVRQEQRPQAATPAAPARSDAQRSSVEEPPRPKPANKEISRPPAQARPVNTPNPVPVTKPAAPAPPAATASNSPAPGTLALPAPAAPVIDVPVPPAQEEVK